MNKQEFCEIIQSLFKDVRSEYELTQEAMAITIGISKKTLVQIEKNRVSLGWTQAVAFISIFEDSKVLIHRLGNDSREIIQVIALQKIPRRQFITLGGETWWVSKIVDNGFTLQQHKISKHYRILDKENYRVFFSFSYKDTFSAFNKYLGKQGELI